jgi:hypothetical protein
LHTYVMYPSANGAVPRRSIESVASMVVFHRRGNPLWLPWFNGAGTPPMERAGTGACPYGRFAYVCYVSIRQWCGATVEH